MYLKEFELDLPYASDKDKFIEYFKQNELPLLGKDKDCPIEWKWIRREFVLETRCITAMFERLFSNYKVRGGRKVLVECVDLIKSETVLNFSGVYVVQVKFNFLDFITLSDSDKKKVSLQLLREGVEKIASLNKWIFAPFDLVFSKIVEENYNNVWVWNKPVKNANKQYVAEVICEHEVRAISIFIEVKNIKGISLGRKLVVTEQPHEFAYARQLGDIIWLTEETVALISKQHDEKWILDMKQLT